MIRELKHPDKDMVIKSVKMSCDVGLCKIKQPLEDYNFFSIIVGIPHSGKTTLLLNLINNKSMYFKKFNKVYLWSPSLHTIKKKLKLKEDRIFENFDIEEIHDIFNEVKEDFKEKFYLRTLFIFDDMNTRLRKMKRHEIDDFMEIVNNRRHAGCSVIITTQKYNVIPRDLRVSASSLFLFNSPEDFDTIYKDIKGMLNSKKWYKIIDYVFNSPHNFLYIKLSTNEFFKNFNKLEFN